MSKLTDNKPFNTAIELYLFLILITQILTFFAICKVLAG